MASLNETRVVKPLEGYSLLVTEVVIIVLNILAVCVIVPFKHKLNPDILIFSLAIADLTKTCVPMTMTLAVYFGWNGMQTGTMACNLFGWSAFTTNSGIMMVMTLMAVDRYAAICWPFQYKHKLTKRRIIMAICFMFAYAGVHSAIPFLPFVGVGYMMSYNNGSFCHFDVSPRDSGTRGYSIYILVIGLSMLAVVIFCYSRAMYDVRKLMCRQRKISDGMKVSREEYRRRATTKMNLMFARMMIVMIVFFCFSWLPFLVVVLCSLVEWDIPPDFHFWSMRIAVANSLVNPLIGAIMCKPYRQGYKFFICKLFHRCGLCLRTQVHEPWERSRMYSTRRSHASFHSCSSQRNEESGNYPSGNSAGDSGIDPDAPGEGSGFKVTSRPPADKTPTNEEKGERRHQPERPKGLTKRISFQDDEPLPVFCEDVSRDSPLVPVKEVPARSGEGILKRHARPTVKRSLSELVTKSQWDPGFLRRERKRSSATGASPSTPPPSPSNERGGSRDRCEPSLLVGRRLAGNHGIVPNSVPNHRPPASLLIGLRRQSAPSAVEVTHFPSFNLEAIQTTTLLSPVTPSQTFKNFPVSSLRAKYSTPDSARHAHEVDCVTQSNERKNRRRSTTDHRSVGSSSPRSRMGSGSDSRSQEHEDESRSSLSSHFQEPTRPIPPHIRSAADSSDLRALAHLQNLVQGSEEVFC